jgi:thymidylate synthase
MTRNKLYTTIEEGQNFHNLWANLVRKVLQNGLDLVIGGGDERKPIRDSCAMINLYGRAISQIERHELHPQFPFKRIKEYCDEFTQKYVTEYREKDNESGFAYLYMDRLLNWAPSNTTDWLPRVDQLSILRDSLTIQMEEKITSNRNQAITWVPHYDPYIHSPCLQRIQIRYIPENLVDVHLTWRSRDLYTAWQPNIVCIIEMLNREIIKPNDCRIVRIIDYNDSLHIYHTDKSEAEKIKRVVTSPQEMSN